MGDRGGEIHMNFDPISREVWKNIFGRILKKGDKVLNIGPGLSINTSDPQFGTQYSHPRNFLNEELWEAARNSEARLVVVDISHNDLLSHRDLQEVTGDIHVRMLEADALQLPLSNASVSGIASSNFINKHDDKTMITLREQADQFLDECKRVLLPGGFLLLSSCGYSVYGRDADGSTVYNNGLTSDKILSLQEIKNLLEEKGFINIEMLPIDEKWIEEMGRMYPDYRMAIEGGGFLSFKG